ncbi:30S ribosomal protein S6 [Acholeplasma sp. OttesenSCG-928-E16]|nr:30S ribosomal protein S6 [Acholeplasma sp. OttesenSCG-928-E16]
MKKYEVMYIVRPNLESEGVKKIVADFNEIFVSRNSKVLELKEIGLKDLAYEIQHFTKGYYVWLLVEANSESIAEFNRVVNITEDVLRHIVVKEGE